MNIAEARDRLAAAFPGQYIRVAKEVVRYSNGLGWDGFAVHIRRCLVPAEIDMFGPDLAALVESVIAEHAEAKP